MVQWVNNSTAEAWVTAEAQVQSPAGHSVLKDPALLQLCIGHSCCSDSILGLGTGPGTPIPKRVQPLKKRKKKKFKSEKGVPKAIPGSKTSNIPVSLIRYTLTKKLLIVYNI